MMDFRHVARRADVIVTVAPFCAASAQAETRGYDISWCAAATHVEGINEACLENRNGGIVEMHIRAIALHKNSDPTKVANNTDK
jgi:hypothetical protein